MDFRTLHATRGLAVALALGLHCAARARAENSCDGRSVLDYGAVANDEYPDWQAFNAAIAAETKLYVPAGTYVLELGKVSLKSNLIICGDGELSILLEKPEAVPTPPEHVTGCDGAATEMISAVQASGPPLRAIVLRDLALIAPDDDAFCEPHTQLRLAGVNGVTIDHVVFRGFRGDAITLGVADHSIVRHNIDVTIEDAIFDGVDRENRQAISILDGEHLTIRDSLFLHTTRYGMPAAIDIEPDFDDQHPEQTAEAVLRDIHLIHNEFYDIGPEVTTHAGLTGHCLSVVLPPGISLDGLTVEHNLFSNCSTHAISFHRGAGRNITLKGNHFLSPIPDRTRLAVRQAPEFVTDPDTNTHCESVLQGLRFGDLQAAKPCPPTCVSSCILEKDTPHVSHPASWSDAQFKSGDFDGDEKTDLLIIDDVDVHGRYTGSGCISIRFGGPGLTEEREVGCNVAAWTNYVFDVGDFDGDNRDDLLGIGQVDAALRYTGLGQLFYRSRLIPADPVASPITTVFAEDFGWWTGYSFLVGEQDGDFRSDLFGIGQLDADGSYTGVGALFTLTHGLLSERSWTQSQPTWAGYRAHVGDFDRDRRSDLLWIGRLDNLGRYTGTGCIFTRSGDELEVHSPVACDETTWTHYVFQTGDFDGDLRTDLVGVGTVDTALRYTGQGCIFTRRGGLGLPLQESVACNAGYWSQYLFHVGDFDGDRRSDLAGIGMVDANRHYTGSGGLLIRTGGPSLPNETVWRTSEPAWSQYAVQVLDRNGDGRSDLMWTGMMNSANAYSGTGILFDRY